MRRVVVACVVLLIILVGGVWEVGATGLSLKECVVRAIERSPELSSGGHLSNADRAYVARARGTTLPYFSSDLRGYEVNGAPVGPWVPLGFSQQGSGRRNSFSAGQDRL
jgi:hypothetical protein